MNALYVVLLALVVPPLLLARRPKLALGYARLCVLALACAIVLAPFVWLVAAIFKDKSVLNQYAFFPPLRDWSSKTLNLENFVMLFEGGKRGAQGTISFGRVSFWQYVLNSTVFATVGTMAQLLFCSLGGYALAKYDFTGKAALMTFMLGSMTIPSVLLLAPLYRMIVGFGLVDTLTGLILPGMVSAYGIFLFRQACLSVPDEMIDAGRIDGCSEFTIYFRLVMPLVRPMAAAFCLMSFLWHWNAFFAPNVFLHSEANLTLPVVLNMYINDYSQEYGVFLAGTAIAVIPPAVLFLVLQKEFISGLTAGAVKG
ncbi:MAG TPA: carbohydrate ABC transporter permease [Polyangiaceae bacterium]|jgi:ABC-type glycerol-3-phosphate transport system permease component